MKKKHVNNYLNKYKLIHESQSRFRQKHSCQMALVKLNDQWMTCLDMSGLVCALFVDFRKSFDEVDHSIWIKIISMYKIDKVSIKWFIPYLNNCQ